MTVTSTLGVTTLLAHLTAVASQGIWEMVCNVLVRDQNIYIFLVRYRLCFIHKKGEPSIEICIRE